MQINLFDGGLSTRLDPSLIEINQAVDYVNIDNDTGVLKSAKGLSATIDTALPNFYRFNDAWVSSANDRDYVEYKDILYWTEPATYPKKFDGTNTYRLGIEAPEAEQALDGGSPILDFEGQEIYGIVIEQEPNDYEDFGFTSGTNITNGGTGTEFPAATYNYRFTLLSDEDEVALRTETIVLGSAAESLVISFGFPKYQRVNIYREYSGTFYYVGQVVVDSAKTFTDSTLDISGNTEYPGIATKITNYQYTMTYYNSSDGTESAPMTFTKETPIDEGQKVKLSNLTVSTDPQVDKKYIYRIGNNLTSFTRIAEINNSTVEYYDTAADISATEILETTNSGVIPEDAEFLIESYGIFFAANGTELVFSDIGEPDYWPPANSISFNRDITGLLPTSQGILVFTAYRSFLLTGTSSDSFAKLDLTEDQGCTAHKSCKTIQGLPIWVSGDGVCSLENGQVKVISKDRLSKQVFNVAFAAVYDEQYYLNLEDGTVTVFDFRRNMAVKEFEFLEDVDSIGNFEGTLYAVADGYVQEVFEGVDLEFNYKSPVFTEGSYSMLKAFNNIYIRSEGLVVFKIIINGEEISSQVLNSAKNINDIKTPQTLQRGDSIQFELNGIGLVYEIELKALGRQNGR